MRTESDGGTAFPFENNNPGMSLREYFAGQALTGLLASKQNVGRDVVELAFHLADRMLSMSEEFYKK